MKGLQRALTHQFVHILNQRNLYNGGIFVGQPRGSEKADTFNRQNGAYHVVIYDLNGIHDIQQITSVVGATTLTTEAGREKFYTHTENPLDLILIGVTEAGIAKGELAMDVLNESLHRYFINHGTDVHLTVINTDNLRNNGDVIRDILTNAYPKQNDDFENWLKTNVSFLTEMGDRLIPQVYAIPNDIKEAVQAQIDCPDELITYAEQMPATPFMLEDLDNSLRVPFGELDDFGVVVSRESIQTYHDWKLLLINSVHVPGITHKGFLSGIDYVNEAASHSTYAPHLERLMNGYADIVETDILIEGKSAHAYTQEFIDRIRRVKDDNARINIIETVKLRERAADIARSSNYNGSTELFKDDFAYAFATVLRFLTPHKISKTDNYRGITDTGTEYEIQDPDRTIQDTLNGAFGADVTDTTNRLDTIFSNASLWSPQAATPDNALSQNQDFCKRVAQYYHELVNGKTCLQVLERIHVKYT